MELIISLILFFTVIGICAIMLGSSTYFWIESVFKTDNDDKDISGKI